MPAGPEVAIMTKFYNEQNLEIERIEVNPISKCNCDISVLRNKTWKVRFESRNREFNMHFLNEDHTTAHILRIGFSKVGTLYMCNVADIPDDFDRIAMIQFYTTTGKVLYVHDYINLASWKFVESFDYNKNPDILFDFDNWLDYMYELRNDSRFNLPIFELMSDNKFFNGINNYSRSEILYRTYCSPFMTFNELIKDDVLRNNFFKVLREVLQSIYDLGGMEYKYWKNPYGVEKNNLKSLSKCHGNRGNSYYHINKKGSRFWFNKSYVVEYMLWANANGIPYMQLHDIRLVKMVYPTLEED